MYYIFKYLNSFSPRPAVFFTAATVIISLVSCHNSPKQNNTPPKPKPPISLKSIVGIPFTEVRRTFDSGLAFEPHGFYQEPSWKFTLLFEDSINIYSPTLKNFVVNPVIIDHDSVVNMAWAWLRVKKMCKDSIIFQVLKVANKEIAHEGPYVYMKLYANSYITDSLHTSAQALQRPTAKDTAFIKNLTAQARNNPGKAFAATQPARFISKTSKILIRKKEVKPDRAMGTVAEESYYSPEYNVTIHKAYDNFSYSFAVTVDEKGGLHFIRSLQDSYGDPDFEKYSIRNIKAILDGYFKYYVKVYPGYTLSIPHSSMVTLNVAGIQD
jgi:hypothetical protein